MELTQNEHVRSWVREMAALTQPDQIVWLDGSETQLDALRAEGMATGEMLKLNEEKLPGCYLHRSDPNDVARVESRTFICSRRKEDAGPTNNWVAPDEMYARLRGLFSGSMRGAPCMLFPMPWASSVPLLPNMALN